MDGGELIMIRLVDLDVLGDLLETGTSLVSLMHGLFEFVKV
jgi:hypothetical protein